ncbi:thermonuclease family protein [Leptolyngbya sp. FACHB-541]|nr:thermonuclease family protein [Leptolyngbya sp. FACHB-541]
MKIREFLLLLCCLLLMGCQASIKPQGTAVQVSRAVSGQTIEVLDPTGQTVLNQEVRLIGIDAPHPEQEPWGTEARERLAELVEGQTVLLEADVATRDSYDRIWGYVWLNDLLVNQQLVEDGLALAVGPPHPKYGDRLTRAQEKARLLGVGIWNPQQPMRQLPCEFRQQRSPDETISCPS